MFSYVSRESVQLLNRASLDIPENVKNPGKRNKLTQAFLLRGNLVISEIHVIQERREK